MKTNNKMEWFEDESFWIDFYPFLFSEKRCTDAVEEVEKIIKLVKLQGLRVLDLCCGPGRCSTVFAQQGFAVTGVDRTAFLLNKARARATSMNLNIEWINADMRDFLQPNAFDFILSMFTSFGYFDNKKEDKLVLEKMCANLKPGGVCLIDVMGKETLAKIFQPTTCEVLSDETILLQRHEIFDDWTRLRNEWILIQDNNVKRYKFTLTIYSGQELRERMEQAGFDNITLYGDLDGSDYGQDARRLIAVGKKPVLS